MSAVIVHTDHPTTPFSVFDADDFRLVEFAGRTYLSVLNGRDRIAMFDRWASAAIVECDDAAELARALRQCARCDERARRNAEFSAAVEDRRAARGPDKATGCSVPGCRSCHE